MPTNEINRMSVYYYTVKSGFKITFMYTFEEAVISSTYQVCLKRFELFTYDLEQASACLKYIQ